MLEQLKAEVCQANLDLVAHGLVTLTWGNVSGLSEDGEHVVIKPSGVAHERMLPEQMVVVNRSGAVVDGQMRPSSDTPTHVLLYKYFSGVRGVAHTHSRRATAFAQARMDIPCLGTTHADHFFGGIPLTRPLTEREVNKGYEENTGKVIVERFKDLDPIATPAVLVADHGPFIWGGTASDAVENAIALETVAEMAVTTYQLRQDATPLEPYMLKKHYQRKHGTEAYYGQR